MCQDMDDVEPTYAGYFFQLLRPAGEIGYWTQAAYALLEQTLMRWPNGQAPAMLQIPGATLG